MQEVPIHGTHITLGQLLKRLGEIGAGGDARAYLAQAAVRVNGEPESRRGRKLRPGDVVALPGRTVKLTPAESVPPTRPAG